MKYGTIATWRMSFEGLCRADSILSNKGDAADAVEELIKTVEDYPYYKSVGYGGLPNKLGKIELDASFMDGNTLQIGAIAGASNLQNPISVARDLSNHKVNNFLVSKGAENYSKENDFKIKKMLTARAKKIWENKVNELKQNTKLKAYDGHDTVGAITLDKKGKLVVATSTSGLFMKHPGRVGDSPIAGSGFYADSKIGAATATGLGEDIMKGCLSYEVVRRMKDGLNPQEACDLTVYSFAKNLKSRNKNIDDIQISIVAMDKNANWGAATTLEFTFCVSTNKEKPQIYISYPEKNKKTKIELVSEKWLQDYDRRIHAKIK